MHACVGAYDSPALILISNYVFNLVILFRDVEFTHIKSNFELDLLHIHP